MLRLFLLKIYSMVQVKPKKHLGQHFLTDMTVAGRIVEALTSRFSGQVLEIGPGKGILTAFLLQHPDLKVTTIDIDLEAIAFMNAKFHEFPVKIVHGDFLKFNPDHLFQGNFAVIGNFPYNISSQIIFKILEYREQVPCVVGMFQREVARRIASPAGGAEYGILSVLVQAFYKVDYLFTVNEGVFFPPPKVKSAVIRLELKNSGPLPCNEKLFFRVVKTAFNQRRKTLRNALSSLTGHEFDAFNPYISKRAQELSVNDFISLTVLVQQYFDNKSPQMVL